MDARRPAATGDALYSLTGTRAIVELADRPSGLEALADFPHAFQVGRTVVAVGAAYGAVLARQSQRAWPLLAAGLLALVTTVLVSLAGLSSAAALLVRAVLCRRDSVRARAARLGRTQEVRGGRACGRACGHGASPGRRHRRSSRGGRVQPGDPRRSLRALHIDCRPVSVPNHRPIPYVSAALDVPPDQIVQANRRPPARGAFVAPANRHVSDGFLLYERAAVPPDFQPQQRGGAWVVYERSCVTQP